LTSKKDAPKCLVVSQLRDTWDFSSGLIFINESVVDYCCLDEFESIEYSVLENCWNTLSYETDAAIIVEEKVNRYRKELAVILNSTHQVNNNESYWGVILDAWLINFLSVALDRFNKIAFANTLHPTAYIKETKTVIHLPPKNAWEFMDNFQTDEYNQYVYIEAAKLHGMKVIESGNGIEHSLNRSNIYTENSLIKNILTKTLNLYLSLRNPTLIIDGYFKPDDTLRIFAKSLGKVVIIPSRFLLGVIPLEEEKPLDRNALSIKEIDTFDVFVNSLLKNCFPKSFFEDFNSIIENNNNWLENISVLGTATCIRSKDEYKIAAAELIKKGGELLGFQHGGASKCFGIGRFEYIETGYVSRYYGWGEKFNFGMGAQKLRRVVKKDKEKESKHILFVSTGHPRHTFWTNVRENGNCFIRYLEDQFSFYSCLSLQSKTQFIYRPYMQDYGWRYKERWSAEFNDDVTFDQNVKLYDSFESARIFVTDHISTTWIEALYSDLPVLMYIDIERLALLPEVNSLFMELMDVGVIHASPESAALFISNTYDNIDEWWSSHETKEIVDKLKYYLISESDNFISDWSKELVSWHK